jgi:hypothetical protein
MKRLLEIVRQVTVVADDSLDDNEGDNARRRPVIISLSTAWARFSAVSEFVPWLRLKACARFTS